MGARSEALAKQFEANARAATATLQKLSEADWKKVTAAENWSVGVTAHHLAGSLERVGSLVKALVAGQLPGTFTEEMLGGLNAQHAKEFASCTKAETMEIYTKGVAAAATMIRGLSDDELAKSGTLFAGRPPMTAEQLITRALINHVDEHFSSIRKAVGLS